MTVKRANCPIVNNVRGPLLSRSGKKFKVMTKYRAFRMLLIFIHFSFRHGTVKETSMSYGNSILLHLQRISLWPKPNWTFLPRPGHLFTSRWSHSRMWPFRLAHNAHELPQLCRKAKQRLKKRKWLESEKLLEADRLSLWSYNIAVLHIERFTWMVPDFTRYFY